MDWAMGIFMEIVYLAATDMSIPKPMLMEILSEITWKKN